MSTQESSQIASFYSNCNVFITGGTGYIGKLTVEKLLRSCPDIGGIYMLIRKKKGVVPEERLVQLFNDPIYDEMKRVNPNFMEKIHPILGDTSYEDLALYPDDRKLLIEQINIVIHCAAYINMIMKLKLSVNANVRSTRDILKMCEEMKNLKAMLYVSTAFSNSNTRTIHERFYAPPIQPETLIKFANEVKEDVLIEITPKLIGDWPNIYTYTKAVAEALIKSKMDDMPIGIIRPSIVIPSYKEPVPGWTNNANGAVGAIVSIAMGILHIAPFDMQLKQDQIPCDYHVNHLICTIPDVAKQFQAKNGRKNIVYNSVSTVKNACTFSETMEHCKKFYTVPFTEIMYAYFIIPTTNHALYKILQILFHYLPALFIDGFHLLTRRKPRLFKLYNTIFRYLDVLNYFSTTEFYLSNDNMVRQWNELNDADKQLFYFNMDGLDWSDYYKTYLLGIRKYLLKNKMDEESMKADCARYQRLLWIHRLVLVIIFTGCAYFIWIICKMYLYK